MKKVRDLRVLFQKVDTTLPRITSQVQVDRDGRSWREEDESLGDGQVFILLQCDKNSGALPVSAP